LGDGRNVSKTRLVEFAQLLLTAMAHASMKDGYLWGVGRSDDGLTVSGHRIGTAEVESALGRHRR